MKVALDIGHLYKTSNPNDRGAMYNGYKEAHLVRWYMYMTYYQLLHYSDVEIYISDPLKFILTGDYPERRSFVNKIFSPTDIYIQGHLNAGKGNYGLVLSVDDDLHLTDTERLYGNILAEELEKVLPVSFKKTSLPSVDRITFLNPEERGYSILKSFKCPAFIIEPLFIDNPKHFEFLIEGDGLMCIAKGIVNAILRIKEQGGKNA